MLGGIGTRFVSSVVRLEIEGRRSEVCEMRKIGLWVGLGGGLEMILSLVNVKMLEMSHAYVGALQLAQRHSIRLAAFSSNT